MAQPKLPEVSSPRGAPMGRRNELEGASPPFGARFYLRRLRWVDGDYDEGGAYWGRGNGGFIWWAYYQDDDTTISMFFRSPDRAGAKDQLQCRFPDARFYR